MAKELRLLHETLILSAERCPDKIAVDTGGKKYSYADLYTAAASAASWLSENGLNRGDRVAIYMDNTWECVVSVFAVLLAGGVFFIINPQAKADKLEYMLNDCKASFLISDSHLYGCYSSVAGSIPSLKGLLYSGAETENPAGVFNYTRFSGVKTLDAATFKPRFVIPNDLSALIYTSGSTGNPKGVMMRHMNMVFASGSLCEYLRLTENDKIFCTIPLAFDYGLYQMIMAIRLGATLVLERSFTYASQTINRIKDSGATIFPGVPTIFATLINMHARTPLAFENIRAVTNTAASLPADYTPLLRQIFPKALIFRMYGLTECKRVSYLEPEEVDRKPTSVGKAIPGTEMFLLSPEGKPVAPGEAGILHVRGPHVMAGYWNKPEQSAKMLVDGEFPGEQVLNAQDWFVMDNEGFFYFKGRSDDIIKTRGEKVSPVEVENAIYSISGIKEAAVVGVDDDMLGSAIKAFVVLAEGANITERDIIKRCMAKLENFMVPKYIEFRKTLPKTDTGKISKKGLT